MTPTMQWLMSQKVEIEECILNLDNRIEKGFKIFKPNYIFLVSCINMIMSKQ